jgi:hypothetical protein
VAAAIDRAARLAQAPAEVYALSKTQLHRPVRERIAANRPVDDPRVLELWSAPDTHDRLRGFIESLHAGKSGAA